MLIPYLEKVGIVRRGPEHLEKYLVHIVRLEITKNALDFKLLAKELAVQCV